MTDFSGGNSPPPTTASSTPAKGTASLFVVAAILNTVAAVMGLVVLKPMRVKTMAKG